MCKYYYDNGKIKVIAMRTNNQNYINYVYLCIDNYSKEAFLVDPAWNVEKIEECILGEGVHLNMVLITHCHEDHTNLAGYFAKKYNISVYVSNDEIQYYKFKCKNLKGFEDGAVFLLYNQKVKCLATPGHTIGSTCFLIDGVVFTGDTLFIEGCGSCEFAGGSMEQMYESLFLLRKYISGETKVFPGHKFKSELGKTFDYVMENNIYFYATTKSQFIKMKERYNRVKVINGC